LGKAKLIEDRHGQLPWLSPVLNHWDRRTEPKGVQCRCCVQECRREAKAGPVEAAVDVKTLHAKIGQLTLENDFLEGALTNRGSHGRNFVRRVGRRDF
jgi:hypothetical protein